MSYIWTPSSIRTLFYLETEVANYIIDFGGETRRRRIAGVTGNTVCVSKRNVQLQYTLSCLRPNDTFTVRACTEAVSTPIGVRGGRGQGGRLPLKFPETQDSGKISAEIRTIILYAEEHPFLWRASRCIEFSCHSFFGYGGHSLSNISCDK